MYSMFAIASDALSCLGHLVSSCPPLVLRPPFPPPPKASQPTRPQLETIDAIARAPFFLF